MLLHPDGIDRGWSRSMRNEGISLMKFYSHRLSVRKHSFNQLLRFGNLTGQYIIDSYMMIEGERLEYFITNQTRIRAETYAGVHDFLQTHASDIGAKLGKKVILPSTFIGSTKKYLYEVSK
jgi:hypothetical protein